LISELQPTANTVVRALAVFETNSKESSKTRGISGKSPILCPRAITNEGKAEAASAETVAYRLTLSPVFSCPIRPDLVTLVHFNLLKNKRQPYAVSSRSGHKISAKSWGTGRALARIPRSSGGGTHSSGHGATGNMCRGGHMSAPTKIWRRWHSKIGLNVKRYATVSALAASAFPSLVMARGHKIGDLPEIPLVLDDSFEFVSNTARALTTVFAVGCSSEIKRSSASPSIRKGRGKMRNRRFVSCKGPMVVHAGDYGITRAFRNLPGVDVSTVKNLGVLQLAPGGHLGRLLLWTKPAIESLNDIFGSFETCSKVKKRFVLPSACMTNSALSRLINSDEIQSSVRPPKNNEQRTKASNRGSRSRAKLINLNPYIGSRETKNNENKKTREKPVNTFYKRLIRSND
jgi:large subunit ribosomal protein L4e